MEVDWALGQAGLQVQEYEPLQCSSLYIETAVGPQSFFVPSWPFWRSQVNANLLA